MARLPTASMMIQGFSYLEVSADEEASVDEHAGRRGKIGAGLLGQDFPRAVHPRGDCLWRDAVSSHRQRLRTLHCRP